jgi:hypothetical protein
VIILGNPKVLSKSPLWNSLLTHYKDNDCLVEGALADLKPSMVAFERPRRDFFMRRYAPDASRADMERDMRPRQAPPPAPFSRRDEGPEVRRPAGLAPRAELQAPEYQRPEFFDMQGPGSMPGYFPGVAPPSHSYMRGGADQSRRKSQKERKRESRSMSHGVHGLSQDTEHSDSQDPYSQSLSQTSAGGSELSDPNMSFSGLSQDSYADEFDKSQGTLGGDSCLSQDSFQDYAGQASYPTGGEVLSGLSGSLPSGTPGYMPPSSAQYEFVDT